MSSDDFDAPDDLTLLQKIKRTRKSNKISLESGQCCIASAMAKIVNRMVNKELQQRCKELLEMEDLAETESRILYILQQIDKEREEESAKTTKNKKRKMKGNLESENDLRKDHQDL